MLGRVGPEADLRSRAAPGLERHSDAALDSMSRIVDPGAPRTYWEDYDPWEEGLRTRRTLLEWMRREGIAAILQPRRVSNLALITLASKRSSATIRVLS